jgi:hypothetical protein
VIAETDRIEVRDPSGERASIFIDDLRAVVIATNDGGALADDCWWLLFADEPEPVCKFPQSAKRQEDAAERLSMLPGFDFYQWTLAMGSTDNAYFRVWNRADVEEEMRESQ